LVALDPSKMIYEKIDLNIFFGIYIGIMPAHPKQQEYNKRWRDRNPHVIKRIKKRENVWMHISKQFRRIGIYDEYQENRGVRIY